MTARSPSPNPTRHTNPNSKTTESSSHSSIRRSGSFNLSKSSIAAEIPQRNSGSKAGRDILPCMRASFEQKENERDPNFSKTPRSRSPSVSSSKGAKSFMAPTISASSKAIGASPMKKILGERNATSGSGMEEIGSKSEMGSCLRDILGSTESRRSDPMIKNRHCVEVPPISPSPSIAPLDADPSLPPYDPKTNYLSPRPRFLHYTPNPRIEHYLDKEGGFLEIGDGKCLEDCFSSESCEDTSGNTEEAQSSPLPQESEEEASPTRAEPEQVTGETHISEPESNSKSRPNGNCSKSWLFRRSKLVPLLLVLIIVCLSSPLSDSPVLSSSSSMLKVHSFGNLDAPSVRALENLYLKDYVTFANVHLKGLARRFKYWSISSITYLSTTAFIPKELGSFYLGNITLAAVEQTEGLGFILTSANQDPESETDKPTEENLVEEECCLGHETKREIAMEVSEATKEDGTEYGTESIGMEALEGVTEGETKYDSEKLIVDVPENAREDDCPVENQVAISHEALRMLVKNMRRFAKNIEIEENADAKEDVHLMDHDMENDGTRDMDQEKSNSGHEALNIEAVATEEPKDFSHDLVIEPDTVENQEHSDGLKLRELPVIGLEDKHLMRIILGLSSAVMLATTFVFLYMMRKRTSVAAHESHRPKQVGSVSGSSESYGHTKGSPFQNFSVEGDLGPSEVSNSSSSFGRQRANRGKAGEALSNEGRPRRDSAVSSSISYGSFTTFEKLSAKKGCRGEDSATPVRRSSRIRNQVASP